MYFFSSDIPNSLLPVLDTGMKDFVTQILPYCKLKMVQDRNLPVKSCVEQKKLRYEIKGKTTT